MNPLGPSSSQCALADTEEQNSRLRLIRVKIHGENIHFRCDDQATKHFRTPHTAEKSHWGSGTCCTHLRCSDNELKVTNTYPCLHTQAGSAELTSSTLRCYFEPLRSLWATCKASFIKGRARTQKERRSSSSPSSTPGHIIFLLAVFTKKLPLAGGCHRRSLFCKRGPLE